MGVGGLGFPPSIPPKGGEDHSGRGGGAQRDGHRPPLAAGALAGAGGGPGGAHRAGRGIDYESDQHHVHGQQVGKADGARDGKGFHPCGQACLVQRALAVFRPAALLLGGGAPRTDIDGQAAQVSQPGFCLVTIAYPGDSVSPSKITFCLLCAGRGATAPGWYETRARNGPGSPRYAQRRPFRTRL